MGADKNAAKEWRGFWFLPVTAALGYATSVIHVYSIGPFIAPLQAEFGWSRGEISFGLTIACLVSALFCIPVGMVVDRFGPRRVGLLGVVLMSASFGLLGTATGSMANWMVLWFLIALGTVWVQATVWTSAVNSRFEKSRGLALAVTLSGASVAAALFPRLAAGLIDSYDWRTAFIAMAGVWTALTFPILFLFFRGAQDEIRSQPTPPPEAAIVKSGMTLAEGLRSAALYKLLIAAGFFSFTIIGAVVHFVPILTDSGAETLTAASIAGLIGIFSIVGRLGTGFLLDRFAAHRVGALAFLLPIIAAVLLLTDGANPVSQAIAAAAIGLTVGSEVDVIAYLAAKHFGLKNFGALYGAMVMALSLGTAFGPLAAGMVYDRFGSYAPFLLVGMVLMAVSALALMSLGSGTAKLVQPAEAA